MLEKHIEFPVAPPNPTGCANSLYVYKFITNISQYALKNIKRIDRYRPNICDFFIILIEEHL